MRSVRMVWLLAFVGSAAGCPVADEDFECANDGQCVDAEIQGVCQPNSYCSFPDPACPSMQRYSELAPDGFAQECVPPSDPNPTSGMNDASGMSDSMTTPTASMVDTGMVDTGMVDTGTFDPSGMVVGGPETDTTTGMTTDTATGTGGMGPFTDTAMTTLMPSTGEDASTSRGTSMGASAACIDIDLDDRLGTLDVRTLAGREDAFSPSCAGSHGPDIAYRWTAPAFGTYRFESGDATIALFDDCDGGELACDDRMGPPLGGTVLHDLDALESVLIIVDAPDAQTEISLRVTEVSL